MIGSLSEHMCVYGGSGCQQLEPDDRSEDPHVCGASNWRHQSEWNHEPTSVPATGKTKIQGLLLGRGCLSADAGDFHFFLVCFVFCGVFGWVGVWFWFVGVGVWVFPLSDLQPEPTEKGTVWDHYCCLCFFVWVLCVSACVDLCAYTYILYNCLCLLETHNQTHYWLGVGLQQPPLCQEAVITNSPLTKIFKMDEQVLPCPRTHPQPPWFPCYKRTDPNTKMPLWPLLPTHVSSGYSPLPQHSPDRPSNGGAGWLPLSGRPWWAAGGPSKPIPKALGCAVLGELCKGLGSSQPAAPCSLFCSPLHWGIRHSLLAP